MCGFVAADDAQLLRRNLRIFSADFVSDARAPRAKQMQKWARAAGKLAILTSNIVRVCAACAVGSAPMMQNVFCFNSRISSADFASNAASATWSRT